MPRARRPASSRALTEQQPEAVEDAIPDVRDGLTRVERVILHELHEAEKEFAGRYVPSALLYGRVVEHVSIDVQTFQRVLGRLAGTRVR